MKKIVFIMVACTLTLLNSCQNSQSSQEAKKTVLRISYNMDPPAIDSRKTSNLVDSALSFKLFCGLNRISPTGEVVPGLAKSFQVSKDQKTYTFHLREACWSDGHPITAYDFEKSWKDIIDPKFPSLTGKLFYCIKNAEKAAKGLKNLNEVGITSLNEKTLQVTLEYPTPYFLNLTAFCSYFPVPQHIVSQNPSWDINPDQNFICSGPFKLESWAPKKELILEKNPYFWAAESVYPDQIRISIVSDQNTALQMFESGKLDWLGTPISPLPFHAEQSLSQQKEFSRIPIAGSYLLSFNTKEFPFSNKNMRKAFSFALDRELMAQFITYNNQTPSRRLLPPPLYANKGEFLIPNNNEALAKKHFEKALEELQLTRENIHITLHFDTVFLNKKTAEIIQERAKTLFGISIKLRESDSQSHDNLVRSHNYQMALVKWIFHYGDAMNILARFREEYDPVNYPQWSDEKFVSLLDKCNRTLDPKKRQSLIEEAERMFIEELPLTPIFHMNYLMVSKKGVSNVLIGSVGDLHFQYVSKEEGKQ